MEASPIRKLGVSRGLLILSIPAIPGPLQHHYRILPADQAWVDFAAGRADAKKWGAGFHPIGTRGEHETVAVDPILLGMD